MSLGEKFRISSKEGVSSSGAISDSNICCSKVSTVLYSGRKEKGTCKLVLWASGEQPARVELGFPEGWPPS